MAGLFTKRKHLPWLALLATAVLLPTVSLLWFMSRVIANERLVVRQKLSALYQDKLADATAKTEMIFQRQLASFSAVKISANPYAAFRPLVLSGDVRALVIWDSDGSVAYPDSRAAGAGGLPRDNPLGDAWQEEFARQHFSDAVGIYGRFTNAGDPRVRIAACMGMSRCLNKLGETDRAIEECERAAFANLNGADDPDLNVAVENARLLLLSLLKQNPASPRNSERLRRTLTVLARDLYNEDGGVARLSPNQNLFVAKKMLESVGSGDAAGLRRDSGFKELSRLIAAEELSISAAESLRPLAGQSEVVFKTRLAETQLYAMRHRAGDRTLLVILSDAGIASLLSGYRDAFAASEASYRVLDAAGDFVAGKARTESQPFTLAPLPAGFPGWKVELYFEGGDVFKKAASRQIAVYTWTGFLVILLIVIAAMFATRAIGRQIRLNDMKNDFIATVSHELKTPLASMRVLVDTLLEGNVKNEAQAREYLQLTARENERLSRMIDNFLTFSRMERNKVAFNIGAANPSQIACDAVESVKTKYDAHHCPLTVEIADDLPEVRADHDAIVTVLVNLLDNACKYTPAAKRISLKVFASDDCVCFAVSDNGIGIARRHLRKIFDRFYQVDSSLSRKAEGCGLGLSIVKFIVDAHGGKMDVESKPDKGSTFTVRLPLYSGNGR